MFMSIQFMLSRKSAHIQGVKMKLYVDDDGSERIQVRLVLNRPSAFARAIRLLKRWRKAPSPRTPGLHAGIYEVRDDFDDPLPDDFLISNV